MTTTNNDDDVEQSRRQTTTTTNNDNDEQRRRRRTATTNDHFSPWFYMQATFPFRCHSKCDSRFHCCRCPAARCSVLPRPFDCCVPLPPLPRPAARCSDLPLPLLPQQMRKPLPLLPLLLVVVVVPDATESSSLLCSEKSGSAFFGDGSSPSDELA
jgi:hypothetical protein